QGEFKGKNILYAAREIKDTASHCHTTVAEAEAMLQDAKARLYELRCLRPRPGRDEKILVDWNGLMISSLAFGSRVLSEPRYGRAAEKAARFITTHLVRRDGRLLHRYCDGEAAIGGMISDYAFFIHGLIDLYEATFSPDYLREAKRHTDTMLRLFWDDQSGGGFFFTADDEEKLIARQKEIYDGALPSGNAVAALDLLRLGRLLMEKNFEAKAELLFKAFSRDISQAPRAFTQTLCALDFALGPSREIIIAGEGPAEETQKMLACLSQRFIPNMVVLLKPGSDRQARETMQLAPFLKDYLSVDTAPAAYVCRNYMCSLPVTSAEQLKKLLDF
ncbi:MAG: thioredoxin domain-containing protein, partial [Pseudomonadota bacterium]